MFSISKKASIPITVFTILVIAVFIFAIASFFLMNVKSIGKITEPSLFVSKFLIKQKNLIFIGQNDGEPLSLDEMEKTGFLGLGKKRLKFGIRKLP